jgi:hypothetical protein
LVIIVSRFKNVTWASVASIMRTRNARQCRERYNNYLAPGLRRDEWTEDEDQLLLKKHAELGPKWNQISKFFDRRSDIALRNRHMTISRRLTFTGAAAGAHQPIPEAGHPDVVGLAPDWSGQGRLETLELDFWHERLDLDDQAPFDSWTALGGLW